jgi:hypothetical protein
MPEPLDYHRDDTESRRKLMRWFWGIIIAKVVLVVANTVGAFSNVPPIVKYVGVGLQLSLTVLFLLLIFRLTAKR